jgi:hypothetical protein
MSTGEIRVGDVTYSSVEAMIAERDMVADKLAAIFATFDPERIEALHQQEPMIVRLYNSYQLFSEAIDRHMEAEKRNDNIRTAWKLVRDLRGEAKA